MEVFIKFLRALFLQHAVPHLFQGSKWCMQSRLILDHIKNLIHGFPPLYKCFISYDNPLQNAGRMNNQFMV